MTKRGRRRGKEKGRERVGVKDTYEASLGLVLLYVSVEPIGSNNILNLQRE